MAGTKTGGKGNKKYGREKKRKAEGRLHPIALFVRNKISAKAYWSMIGLSGKVTGGGMDDMAEQ
jgi:hypothetical protein